jgi:hypothetical protein
MVLPILIKIWPKQERIWTQLQPPHELMQRNKQTHSRSQTERISSIAGIYVNRSKNKILLSPLF